MSGTLLKHVFFVSCPHLDATDGLGGKQGVRGADCGVWKKLLKKNKIKCNMKRL